MSPHSLLVFACLFGIANAHHSTGNLAATIRATQSSTGHGLGDASHAIDGNENADFNLGSCSRTALEANPWWRVDLFYHYRVYTLEITTSKDGGALTGAKINIGDSTKNNGRDNELCATIESIPAGVTRIVRCNGLGVHGRFITISVASSNTSISLCEVEAFGAHDPHHEEGHEHSI
ncbi:fucolectin-like [Scyliorhinus canicula]|uniref:fucolectin-like n=1 Tax=Scyliorhinus canicula TaxID=7830 RepID=UPI0018F36AC9|nr:fucolectin-like [Scyliorhinus canicula]